jgi:cell fate regulator YaaT (PSP1 superfamily)
MENGYKVDAMTEWYTGTVIEEATRTDKNVWGWSSETSNSRSDVFDDEKEDGGADMRAVDLLFLGVPLLATLFLGLVV